MQEGLLWEFQSLFWPYLNSTVLTLVTIKGLVVVLCITLTGPPDRTVCVCVHARMYICVYALSSTFMQKKTKDHK